MNRIANWFDHPSLRTPALALRESAAPLHHVLAELIAAAAPLLPWEEAETLAWLARLRQEVENP